MSEILSRTVFETCLADQTEAPWEEEVRLILAHDAALRAENERLLGLFREIRNTTRSPEEIAWEALALKENDHESGARVRAALAKGDDRE